MTPSKSHHTKMIGALTRLITLQTIVLLYFACPSADWGSINISNFHSDGNEVGIMLNGSHCVQVTNSCFTQNQTGAIVMKNANQNIVNGVIIISTNDTKATDGVRMDGKSNHNIVMGSTISGYKGYGINLTSADAQNNMITNNIVAGNTAGGLNDLGSGTTKQNNTTR